MKRILPSYHGTRYTTRVYTILPPPGYTEQSRSLPPRCRRDRPMRSYRARARGYRTDS